jgi:hypothetical protein
LRRRSSHEVHDLPEPHREKLRFPGQQADVYEEIAEQHLEILEAFGKAAQRDDPGQVVLRELDPRRRHQVVEAVIAELPKGIRCIVSGRCT